MQKDYQKDFLFPVSRALFQSIKLIPVKWNTLSFLILTLQKGKSELGDATKRSSLLSLGKVELVN